MLVDVRASLEKDWGLVGCFWMSCLMVFDMYSNVSLDTRKRFLNLLTSQLLYLSIHHDLFCTLLLVLPFLSFTWHKAAAAGTITPMSYAISSSFIFLFLHHISSISSKSSSRLFFIFSQKVLKIIHQISSHQMLQL